MFKLINLNVIICILLGVSNAKASIKHMDTTYPVKPVQVLKIISSNTSIVYYKKNAKQPSGISRQITYHIEYWSDSTNGNVDMPITLELKASKDIKSSPTINSLPDVIKGTSFSKVHRKDTFVVFVKLQQVDNYAENEMFTFGIKGYDLQSSFVTVKLEEEDKEIAEKFDNENEAWLEAGTNIDLIDGIQASNLTAGIFAHLKDKSLFCWKNKFSFLSGVYETKSFSFPTQSNFNYTDKYLTEQSFSVSNPDSVKWFKYFFKNKEVKTIRNWSIFASPTWRLTDGQLKDGKFHVSIGGWFEFQRQEVNITNKYDSLKIIEVGKVKSNDPIISAFKVIDSSGKNVNLTSHYLGLGTPFYYETSSIQLMINPFFGWSNQPRNQDFEQVVFAKNVLNERKWLPFYVVQFRLSEKLLGITFTGEIRGLLVKNAPPVYTMALSKKFNLSQLLKWGK